MTDSQTVADTGSEEQQQESTEMALPSYEEAKGLTSDAKVPEVKITSNEAKIDLGEDGGPAPTFKGLTKEELAKFANDPFWVKLRWSLFILFWVVWVAMLAASVVIIIYAPKCPSPEPKQWWQKGPIYRMDVARFKDSDADGVGDFKGLEEELDYLVGAGVNTVYLSSIFKTPGKATDNFDISDYVDVDSKLGSLATWRSLVEALKSRNLKVVIDFIPNHTSDEHEWFEKSVAGEERFRDFYVWQEGGPGSPPTSWKDQTGGSGWEYNQGRGAWFLHNYGPNQPDLNLENPAVIAELQNVMEFWMAEGVDGFNIHSATLLVEDLQTNQPDAQKSREVLAQFRETVDAEAEAAGEPRIIMAITDLSTADLSPLYGEVGENNVGSLVHLPVGQSLLDHLEGGELTASGLVKVLSDSEAGLPARAWQGITLDSKTFVKPDDMVDPLNMLTLLLAATPLPHFGEETGSSAGDAMMDWTEVGRLNQAAASKGQLTHLTLYSQLAELRHAEAILLGDTSTLAYNTTFLLTRVRKGNPGYLLAINLGTEPVSLDLSAVPLIAENIRLLAASIPPGDESAGVYTPDPDEVKRFAAVEVPLKAREARVFTFVPKFV